MARLKRGWRSRMRPYAPVMGCAGIALVLVAAVVMLFAA